MTTLHQIARAALALPDAVEQRYGRDRAYVVGDARFVAVTDGVVELALGATETSRAATEVPGSSVRGGLLAVPLAELGGMAANSLVRRAYVAVAPADAATAVTAPDSARAGAVGDLPRSIGNPATRALVGAGITTLAEVARRSDEELLALHGVGPRAVRLLRETR
ncbi:MAG TPA: hypothetical protein VGE77_04915 [Nocardioides sp.]